MHDFSIDKSKHDGRSIYCYNCRRKILKTRISTASHKEYRKTNRHKYKRQDRNWRLKVRYGITIDQFDVMFAQQNHSCALCKSKESDGPNFVVDHCHKTGFIRGILCSYCNRALGMLKDDVDVLKKAIAYLEAK